MHASGGKRRWQQVATQVATLAKGSLEVNNYTPVVADQESTRTPAQSGETSVGPSTVAIIGGGVAGLACGRRLKELGVSAVVYDTGKRGPGGRASSRHWRGHNVDHAAQFVVATDPLFVAELTSIAAKGAARQWGGDGRFGILSSKGYAAIGDGVPRWIGMQGMTSIVEALAEGVDVRQDIWVPPSNGIQFDPRSNSWGVLVPDGHGSKKHVFYDAVVVAHNGKCAERLTSTSPALEVHALLRANFAASLPRDPGMGGGRFTLNQVYSLLFEVPFGIMPRSFDAAFVENEPRLRFLSSNTAKFGARQGDAGFEAWTALSSATFGKQHKAPQEFLEGTPKEAEVTKELLDATEKACGIESGALRNIVRATKLQLWGAALPINRWASVDGADFVWSAAHKIGIAGDWLTPSPDLAARASTIEAAWLSGRHLAEHIARASSVIADAGLMLGRSGGTFVPVDGDFGSAGHSTAGWVSEILTDGGKDKGKGYKGKGKSKGW